MYFHIGDIDCNSCKAHPSIPQFTPSKRHNANSMTQKPSKYPLNTRTSFFLSFETSHQTKPGKYRSPKFCFHCQPLSHDASRVPPFHRKSRGQVISTTPTPSDLISTTAALYIKDLPSHRQRLPTPLGRNLAFLLRRRYRYHIYICILHHFLSQCPMTPSTRLLLFVSSRLRWSFRGTVVVLIDEMERLLDNAGLWYVYNQSLGSNECLWETRGLLRQGNELVHHPTEIC